MSAHDDPDGVPVEVARPASGGAPADDAPGAEAGHDGAQQDELGAHSGAEPEEADVRAQLEEASRRALDYEEKLKHAMADFQNLERKTRTDIENGVNAGVDALVLDFLGVYDEFVLARNAFSGGGADAAGLDSILRNMDSLLKKHGVSGIDALGEIFDPNLHEAVSVAPDPGLDEGTVTREIRKGYISRERVIRPSLVEISKKG